MFNCIQNYRKDINRVPRSCLISKNHCLVAASYKSILLSYILLYKKLLKRDRIKVLIDRLIQHYLRSFDSLLVYKCELLLLLFSLSDPKIRKQKLYFNVSFSKLQVLKNCIMRNKKNFVFFVRAR